LYAQSVHMSSPGKHQNGGYQCQPEELHTIPQHQLLGIRAKTHLLAHPRPASRPARCPNRPPACHRPGSRPLPGPGPAPPRAPARRPAPPCRAQPGRDPVMGLEH
jgi:hypothetical protein